MLIQITTGIKLIPIKKLPNKRILCKCYEDNYLWKKGKQNIYYECEIRPINLFEISDIKEVE